jgi:tripartite-type tricarboxylate transporter receptor subunit TctC
METTMIPASPRRRHLVLGTLASLALPLARAQAPYPGQPIRIVVPYPPGGATDTLARMVAARLQEAWGQSVIVDNKPGASGTIGNDMVVRAAPDGYTVLMGITALIQQPSLMPKLPYDPLRDLAPVSEVARVNSALAVPGSSPSTNYKDFVAAVKANPGKYSFGSYGAGTSSHIQGSLLNQQAGLDMLHVPYKGSAPLLTDLIGGQLNAAFVDVSSAGPHFKSGKARALAVTGTARNRLLPDVPTLKELGLHSFEPYGWFGLFMPAATPPAVIDKFSAEVGRILRLPDVVAKVEDLGVMPVGNKPAEFGVSVRQDAALYARIIKDTKITLE